MPPFRVQVGKTDPWAWQNVRAKTRSQAAAQAAAVAGPGVHTVYVAPGEGEPPDGSTVATWAFVCEVD